MIEVNIVCICCLLAWARYPRRKRHQTSGNDLLRVGKAERTGQCRSARTRGDDRAQWTFGRLLDWHLRRGTRPGGRIDRPGRSWTAKAFADAIGVGDRTVRYWLRNEHLPPEVETIERILFGKDPDYPEWRLELRQARADAGLHPPSPNRKPLPVSHLPIPL